MVGVDVEPVDLAAAVGEEAQAVGDLGRVLLLERAGGGVAGVGEGLVAAVAAFLVDVSKDLVGHVDLAADFEHGRRVVGAEREGDRADRADVGGDVVALPPVAPGDAANQSAVLVAEAHGHAVDLGLDHEAEVFALGKQRVVLLVRAGFDGFAHGLGGALVPRRQLLAVVRVVDRKHRHVVIDRGERLGRLAAHPLGRGIRRDQIGVLLLEIRELLEQLVVRAVGDLGVGLDVVEVVVMPNLLAELLDTLTGFLRRLGHAGMVAAGKSLNGEASNAMPDAKTMPRRQQTNKTPRRQAGQPGHVA